MRRLLLGVVTAVLFASASAAWASWSEPFGVSASPADRPQSLFAPDGTAFVWWEDVARYAVRPPGGPFGPQQSIGAEAIDIDVDASSRALIAWVTSGNSVQAMWRSPQGTFSAVETIASNLGGGDDVGVDVNPQGEALVSWTVPGGTEQVRVAYSPAGPATAFDDTPQLLDTAGSTGFPNVVLDAGPQPDAVAIWQASGDIRQATTTDASANDPFGPKTDIDADAGGGQLHVASNATGVAAAVWRSGSNGVTGLYPRTATRSPGGGFGAFQTHADRASVLPRAAVGAGGATAAVWEEEALDTETCTVGASRIALATGSSAGMMAQGYVSEATLNSHRPGVAVGPTGQSLITWHAADCDQDGVNVVRLRMGATTHTPVSDPAVSLDAGYPAFDADGDALALWTQDDLVKGAFFTAPSTPPKDGEEEQQQNDGSTSGAAGATAAPGGSPGAAPPQLLPPPRPAPTSGPSNVFTLRGGLAARPDGTATLTLVAPGPGSVVATATGASSARAAQRRRPVFARGRARARRAGAVRVTLRPTSAGKRLLRRSGRLRVRVAITFTPDRGAPRTVVRSVTLRLRRR